MARRGNGNAPAIGIDLGTTYSCVAVWLNDRVEIIPNDQGNRTMPSCVSFTDGGRLIGEGANNLVATNPSNTIYDAKRLIGRRFSDAKVQEDMKLWPFKVINGTNEIPKIVVAYQNEVKEFSAEEISSMILSKLKEIAETFLGKTVKDVVITVPAYFDDSQRQATKDAGYVAGLNVLQILNEPTSAAIAYGLDTRNNIKRETNVLIFDLGGGTFDVAIVNICENSNFKVKAVDGDTHLGGQDFDNMMMNYFVEGFNRRHRTDVSGNKKALGRLRPACEKAKRVLSSVPEATVEIDNFHNNIDLSMRISRAKFENLNADFFNKCIVTVERCLREAKMDKKDVDEVVLVGGSTRIPRVKQLLQEFFNGKKLSQVIHPDEAVAHGAALRAANLSGNETVENIVLMDVVPLSLGVRTHGDLMSVIIPRNTPIPVTKEKIYCSVHDNQSVISVIVYQGERSSVKRNNWLGQFDVSIPIGPAGEAKVKEVFHVDANGILSCSGEEMISGQRREIIISHDKHRLSKVEIEKMLKDAEKYKLDDQEFKKKVRARNALEKYIDDMERKLKTIRKTSDKKKLEDAIEDARQCLDGSKLADVKEYAMKQNQLEKLCVPIIAKYK